jgi:AAA15 family ATPase/GTPase
LIMSNHLGKPDEEVQRFSDLRIKSHDELVVTALKVIEPRLEKLEILSRQGVSMIHGYLKGYNEPVPSPLLGDGVKRVMSLLLAIGNARNGVVLIDEIENGIHHSMMQSVWNAIAEASVLFKTQIFATTHSAECILAAHEAYKKRNSYDFRIHRLDRINGEIKAGTYDQETLEGALSIPLEVRG